MKIGVIPRLRYAFKCSKLLTPEKDTIDHADESTGYQWLSMGESSILKIEKKPVLSGWYMLEIEVESDSEYLDSQLFFSTAHSSPKKYSASILLINRRLIKRVIFIPKGVSKISFSPSQKATLFSFKTFSFVKLTKKSALKQMNKKLKTYITGFDECSTAVLWKKYTNFHDKQIKTKHDYSNWVTNSETKELKAASTSVQQHSFTAIINLVDVKSLSCLSGLLNELKTQIYTNWKVVIILSENSIISHKKNEIKQKLKFNTVNFINGKNIKAFDLTYHSKSDYYVLLNHNTHLSKYAFSVFAKTIQNSHSVDFVYGDHDTIDNIGTRFNPIFKPDWNPDLILSHNYIGSFVAINYSILSEKYNLNIDSNGAWVYRLLTMQALQDGNVQHSPNILSHLKKESLSVDLVRNCFGELFALKKTLKGIADVNYGKSLNTFKVTWPLLSSPPKVSIIIPTRDGYNLLVRAVDSILKLTNYPEYEILIVDNQSKDNKTIEYFDYLRKNYYNIKIITYEKDFNYSAINNLATSFSSGQVLALVNNDIEVISPDWLTEMTTQALRPEIGCVGAMLYYPDERIQHAGVIMGLGGCAGHSHKFYKRRDFGYMNRLYCTQNYSAVTGACLVLEKSIFDAVNGLNEIDLAVAFNDVDLCLKVQSLGYRNLWTPWAELYHYESVSRGEDNTKVKRQRLTKEVNYIRNTWLDNSTVDPHYNKNLTMVRQDFSLGI
ncbi:glycosyltransferase [Leucothrix sargassi]|nr:glycosyltransferase [Leucothrix sargassi]